jgi:hypothetical protein
MGNIEPYRRDMNQLSVDFDRIVTENEVNIYAFCEGKPMEQEVRYVLVEMWFMYTRDGLILLGTDMFILGSIIGLGNFGGV